MKIVRRDVFLSLPNFSEEFMIHTDASKMHLRGVINKKDKTTALCSQKLTPAQINHTNVECEMLNIV